MEKLEKAGLIGIRKGVVNPLLLLYNDLTVLRYRGGQVKNLYLNYTVNDKLSHIKPVGYEGGSFEVNKGYMTFIVLTSNTTAEDVENFQKNPVTFGFCSVFGAFVCALKIAGFDWIEGFFTENTFKYYHRAINQPNLDYDSTYFVDGEGCEMVILLVDSASKKILGKRVVKITPEATSYMKSCLEDQKILTTLLLKEYHPNPYFFIEYGQIYSHFTIDIILDNLKHIHISD